MKIFNFDLRKSTTCPDYEFFGQIVEDGLNHYSTYEELKQKAVEALAKELYPTFKDKMLEEAEFKKIINEVRLKVAKHFVEEK